jgi:positive regulator of sigma E activity
MFITEFQAKGVLIAYMILLVLCIVVILYAKRISFQEKLIRLLAAIFLPIIGVSIVLVESLLSFLKERKQTRKSNLI